MRKAPEAGKQVRTRRLFRTVPVSLQGLTSTVILQTTITPPRLPVPHVARPRLLALLEQGLRGPLTLVSAPAGSGKTTLLAAWAAMTTRPVAWLSCEEGENDPARLLSSLSAALACLDERLGAAAETDRPWQPDEHERVLTRLLNDLERLLPDEAVLILDDVHQLTTEASQALLLFLLSHLPSQPACDDRNTGGSAETFALASAESGR